MGAWDATSFGNDTANDWVYTLEKSHDLSYVESTIQTILDTGDDYLDADEASEAIAAAEVIASIRGKAAQLDAYTEKVAAWVAAHPTQPSPELVQNALAALERIEQEPSELMELWEGDPDWTAAVADLRRRLS